MVYSAVSAPMDLTSRVQPLRSQAGNLWVHLGEELACNGQFTGGR